jgi:hypothetical protein
MVGDFQSLRSWRCECEGFRPISGPFADASFAAAEDAPVAPLRVAGPERGTSRRAAIEREGDG